MGSDPGVVGRAPYAHPLTFGSPLNPPYFPFKDAQNHPEQVHIRQQCMGCFSYLSYGTFSVHEYSSEPAFIHKRNERERQRVRCVNEGYARLREHLPQELEDKRLSKVETLRAAISYIKHLQKLLERSLRSSETGRGAQGLL